MGRYQRHDDTPYLVFVNNADFIFNRPFVGHLDGFDPVIEGNGRKKSANANDRHKDALVPGLPKPLLHYSVSDSPDDSCFKYLLALPNIDTIIRFDGRSVLHSCSYSSTNFSPSALETLLNYPGAPSVNDVDINNMTPLHHLCMRQSQPYNIRIPKLKLLLDNGADPILTDVTGAMPIDVLYRFAAEKQRDEPEFEEMAGLILQGKRDVFL